MQTISITDLKSHLSAELKKVQKGTRLVVLDHSHPVAEIIPTETEELFIREAEVLYVYETVTPITTIDPEPELSEERSDRW